MNLFHICEAGRLTYIYSRLFSLPKMPDGSKGEKERSVFHCCENKQINYENN